MKNDIYYVADDPPPQGKPGDALRGVLYVAVVILFVVLVAVVVGVGACVLSGRL